MDGIFGAREIEFAIDLALALFCGMIVGLERELRGKPAGISTQTLVITGAMMFSFFSRTIGEGILPVLLHKLCLASVS